MYVLIVQVKDVGIFFKFGICVVVINVLNINDVLLEFMDFSFKVNVSEDVVIGVNIIIMIVISREVG